MEKRYCLYIHTNLVNNKKYIGVTSEKPEKRWGKNGSGYIGSVLFYKAIQKYGWNNFSHEIIDTNLTVEEANNAEKYWIQKLKTNNKNFGYNLTSGGIGLYTGKGSNYNKFGAESNGHSKKVKCIETGDIFGSITEAERWSDSCKVGECCHGLRNFAGCHPVTHQPLSWEFANEDDIITIYCHKKIFNSEKKLNGKAKKVRCIETGEIFESETDACNKYNCAKGTIGRACNGKRKTALKKHWEWIEEEGENNEQGCNRERDNY